ncbi:MAG TPA: hypothetical protein VNW47_02605 [Terriglobales bacterium]|jgi:probable HAF family extracellular repeat protein|nr:hypothetical protein [Terriglobales bacterium]
MKRLHCGSVMLFATLLCSNALAQLGQTLKFSVVDLGLMGGVQTAANAINNNSVVAGDISYSDGSSACFLWSTQATITWTSSVQDPKQLKYCNARALDQSGSVAGTIKVNSSAYPLHAYRRTRSGAMIDLVPPVASQNSYADGIDPSGSGIVVGTLDTAYAIEWSSTGSPKILSKRYARASAINASGQVVGSALSLNNTIDAWEWAGSTSTDLGGLGGYYSVAYAINATGVIVGEAESGSGCIPHYAVWVNGLPSDGGCGNGLLAISSDGWAVGFNVTAGPDCYPWVNTNDACTGVILVQNKWCGGIYDLGSLLDSSGVGWTIKHANGINDSHVIAGYGIAPDGKLHAIVLVPNGYPLCYQR